MGTPWRFRAIPALTHLSLVGLFVLAFCDWHWFLPHYNRVSIAYGLAVSLRQCVQWTLALFMILVTLLAGLYTCRLCWATFWTTCEITKLADSSTREDVTENRNEYFVRVVPGLCGHVKHAILVPSYREHVETLRETLSVLASHHCAKRRYDIFLAMEETDPNAEKIAHVLIDAFRHRFWDIQHTVHPAGILGEAQGKSSNISWTAKRVSDKYHENLEKEDVILTILDADSHLSSTYFRQLTRMHLENSDPRSRGLSYYMPPIIFDRNSSNVPPFVRTADLLWCGAALSGIYPGSTIAPPASVYSLPLALADAVGGWDTGPEAIGEDLHMYLKCYFATRGAISVRPIYSAASQCDACSDEAGIRGFFGCLQARWSQAVRHMWGSVDTGYAVRQGLRLWRTRGNGSTLLRRRAFLHLVLFHRIFEAHFLPMLLPLSVIASAVYQLFVPAAVTPPALLCAFRVCGILRNLSFGIMIFWFHLYERYHYVCVSIREVEMTRAGLKEDVDFTYRRGAMFWVDWFIFPLAGVMFGALPAIKAQGSLIFTDRLGYKVTLKPLKDFLGEEV